MPKLYKYAISYWECPVCGRLSQTRERVPIDTDQELLHKHEFEYCGCLDRELYG